MGWVGLTDLWIRVDCRHRRGKGECNKHPTVKNVVEHEKGARGT